MNILFRLSKLVKMVRKRSLLFLLALFFVHIIFIASFSYVQLRYQVPVAQGMSDIIVAIGEVNFNPDQLQAGVPLLPKGVNVYAMYLEVVRNVKLLVIYSLLVLSVIGGFSWALINYLYRGGGLLVLWGRSIVTSLAYLIPYAGVVFLLFRSGSFGGPGQPSTIFFYWLIGILLVVVFHFMVISLSLGHYPLKKIFRRTLKLAVSRLHHQVLLYLIVVAFLAPFVIFLYYGVVSLPFSMLVLSSVLYVTASVIAQLVIVDLFKFLDKQVD